MDNLAYLHLADAYENSFSGEPVCFSSLLNKTTAPDWKSFSGGTWQYILPVVLALSIFGSVSSVSALERGDQGPSVKHLQAQLRQVGFFPADITGVYDFHTENAVRRFQKAHGLMIDGIVGIKTQQTLENLLTQQSMKPPLAEKTFPTVNSSGLEVPQLTRASTPFAHVKDNSPQAITGSEGKVSAVVTKTIRQNPHSFVKGDEGEQVRVLQERLRVAGFYSGNATGVFGPITEEAVKRFQKAHQLEVDGVVGLATLRKLPPVGVGGEVTSGTETVKDDYLTIGHRGEAVRLLQKYLIQAGYLHGTVNGYFGAYTANAVRRFQGDHDLPVSGIATPATIAQLYSLINTAPCGELGVMEIQRRLQNKGFYQGSVNGVLTGETKKAIHQAQEFYGISISDVGGEF